MRPHHVRPPLINNGIPGGRQIGSSLIQQQGKKYILQNPTFPAWAFAPGDNAPPCLRSYLKSFLTLIDCAVNGLRELKKRKPPFTSFPSLQLQQVAARHLLCHHRLYRLLFLGCFQEFQVGMIVLNHLLKCHLVIFFNSAAFNKCTM